MEMTKERLEAYRSNCQEIKELTYTLEHRWESETMIGVDTILNYSKGYPIPEGIAGFDQKKYERLQNRDLKRKAFLENECKECEEFVDNIKDSITRRIFRMYFLDGTRPVNQNNVARKVHLDRSSISKRIDRILKLSHNSQKSQL